MLAVISCSLAHWWQWCKRTQKDVLFGISLTVGNQRSVVCFHQDRGQGDRERSEGKSLPLSPPVLPFAGFLAQHTDGVLARLRHVLLWCRQSSAAADWKLNVIKSTLFHPREGARCFAKVTCVWPSGQRIVTRLHGWVSGCQHRHLTRGVCRTGVRDVSVQLSLLWVYTGVFVSVVRPSLFLCVREIIWYVWFYLFAGGFHLEWTQSQRKVLHLLLLATLERTARQVDCFVLFARRTRNSFIPLPGKWQHVQPADGSALRDRPVSAPLQTW